MSIATKLPYTFAQSSEYPHIAWVDLYNNGTIQEVAVVALDNRNADLYFIPIASLDAIDRQRLLKIVTKRDAGAYSLWDLMSSTSLKNGVNALEYFHQLVRVKSYSGQIFSPGVGKAGAVLPANVTTRPNIQSVPVPPNPSASAQYANRAPEVSDTLVNNTQVAAAPKKGPGRPPSVKR